jgi:hypothetical protein
MSLILSFDQYLFESSSDGVVNSFYSAIKSTQSEESPRGSNKGPTVEPLQKGVGANPGDPWCVAFIYKVLDKTNFSPDIKKQIPNDAA